MLEVNQTISPIKKSSLRVQTECIQADVVRLGSNLKKSGIDAREEIFQLMANLSSILEKIEQQ